MSVQIRLLGAIEIVADGEAIGPSGPIAKRLLGRLASQPGRTVPSSVIIEEIWNGEPPPSARQALRVHVTTLRKLLSSVGLKDVLRSAAGGYGLMIDTSEVDLAAVEGLIESGRALRSGHELEAAQARFQEAREALRAEPFAGAAGLPCFMQFTAHASEMLAAATRLHRECVLERGLGSTVVAELEDELRDNPLDEVALASLLQALYQSGRHLDAVQRYTAHRAALADRGLIPGPHITSLENSILRHDPAVASRVDNSLPVVRHTFVGRDRERELLRSSLHAASTGAMQIVLVTGDAGVGKTRLLAEALARSPVDALVLAGRCSPEQSIPYEPFIEGLSSTARASIFEDVHGAVTTDMASEHRRALFFASILGEMDRLASLHTLVVVVDDMHWADASSTALTRHLCRHLRSRSVMLLIAARSIDTLSNAGAHALFDELEDDDRTIRISLHGLTFDEMRMFLDGFGGRRLTEAEAHDIHVRSLGNPLFGGELARQLVETGAARSLPSTIRAALTARVSRLSSECQRALSAAAVIGTSFKIDSLAGLTTLSTRRLRIVIEEAVEAEVVDLTMDANCCVFHHELLRLCFLERVKPARRAQLHVALAGQLSKLDRAGHIFEIARHLEAAGAFAPKDSAVIAAVEAATRAINLCAFDAAAEFCAFVFARAPGANAHRAMALVGSAIAESAAGRTSTARAQLDEARTLAERIGLDAVLATAIRASKIFDHEPFADIRTIELLRELVDRLREAGDVEGLEHALIALVFELRWVSERRESRRYAEELVAMATASRNPAAKARAWAAVQQCLYMEGAEPEERFEAISNGRRAAEECGDDYWRFRFGLWAVAAQMSAGRIRQASKALADLQQRDQLAWPSDAWGVESSDIALRMATDDLEGLEAVIVEVAQQAHRRGVAPAMDAMIGQMLVLRMAQDRLAELEPMLAGARKRRSSPVWTYAHTLSMVCTERADEAGVIFADSIRTTVDEVMRDLLWIPELMMASEVCATIGTAANARLLIPLLARFRGQHATIGGTPIATLGPTDRLRALLLIRAGHEERGLRLLDATRRICTSDGSSLWARRCDEDLNRVLKARTVLISA